MNLAVISLGALLVAIVVSCTTRINVGYLSIAFAWIIGVYLGGQSVTDVAAGFPTQLFLTLVGVTLLFAQAQVNGTLDRVAHHALRLCRGNHGVIPIMFFFLGLMLASIGPGNIASAALVAPMAMAVAGRTGISPFLMALMVGNGANAGSLSPFAPTGIIVNGLMAKMGMTGMTLPTYLYNLLAHATVAFGGYFLFGGWRLFRRSDSEPCLPAEPVAAGGQAVAPAQAVESFQFRQWATLGVIGALIVSVIFFKVNVGMGAFAGVVLLAFFRAGDDAEAIRRVPWSVIVMVTGVTVLIALLERTGGIDLFSSMLARLSTPGTVTAVIALLTGLVSAYSSTSGVVLPAFLPTAPGLAARLGSVDPLAIVSAMNVGGHLVDVSPLSTIGALCIAAAPAGADTRALFNKLLAWGLSMAVVGAAICYLFFHLLW